MARDLSIAIVRKVKAELEGIADDVRDHVADALSVATSKDELKAIARFVRTHLTRLVADSVQDAIEEMEDKLADAEAVRIAPGLFPGRRAR